MQKLAPQIKEKIPTTEFCKINCPNPWSKFADIPV
jgi:hypothetical protein